MPSPAKSSQHLAHIPELDGVRGLAALMVVCHHLFFTSIPNPERWNLFVLFASKLSHAGGNGVDLFFVLSGFLITSLLVLDRDRPHFYWNFYWKRALRIFPLYLVALALLAIFSPATWSYTLLSFLFLANFAQAFHIASSGPFWTLAIEEQFYLIWPRLVSSCTVAELERLATAIVIASPLLRLIAAALGHHNYEFTFFHCDGLGLGAMLACRRIRRSQDQPYQAQLNRPRLSRRVVVLAAGAALTALPALIALRFGEQSRVLFAADALQLSGISLLCYSMVSAAVEETGAPLLAIFRSRTLTFFGLISYCLYIVNGYAVNLYDHFHGPMQTGSMRQYTVRALAVFAVSLAVCIFSRYAIELPAMSLRKRVLRRP